MSAGKSEGLKALLAARDFLFAAREDYGRARREFRWPQLTAFNWALDYFDELARGNQTTALWIVGEDGAETKISFEEMGRRSNQVARFLRRQGVRRGDRIILMLPNVAATWECILAAMKLGAVVIPAATLLTTEDLRDRLERGKARHVVAMAAATQRFAKLPGDYSRIVVGGADGAASGWIPYEQAYDEPGDFTADGETEATDPFLLYFTSGTTALPKLVLHTHESYPVGHLATMYWIGIRPGDVHLNISSPGWAKHAWSCFFAPWNAGATIFIHAYGRFDAKATLSTIARCGVTTLCAPPTVWRMLVLEDLKAYAVKLRELASAGEPLNPEVIEKVRRAWNLTIRDGYGQTENVCLLGNFPGQAVKPGAVGKPSPGHEIVLLDLDGRESDDGEISIRLEPRPPSLMVGYLDDPAKTAKAMEGGYYRTGDVAHRDADGYFTYVGRADDVFKSSDYRISPFELESALIEHASIAEAAVVPSPDPLRWSVPKAFIVLKPGIEPSREAAGEIFQFIRGRLGPYKRIRRIEFSELPKTISGKIRRVELRGVEQEARKHDGRRPAEFWEEDFPELKQ
ncbi:MAG TPA: AMP-binding protein [Candidatus Binatia bacterium]|nr:AMP-binding protein [Candidatus Binatia bacterium]